MLRLAAAVIAINNAVLVTSLSPPLKNNFLRAARKLDDGQDDYSWLIDNSIRFESCHTEEQYSVNDGQGSVYVQKLVKFNMCPTEECGSSCNGGKYLVQMGDFVEAYADQKEEDEKKACEEVKENCECENDEEDCEYNCFVNSGLDYCIEDEDEGEAVDIRNYVECQEYDMEEGDDEKNEEQKYYIGLKCSKNGKGISLGIFTDEYCTVEREDSGESFSYPYQNESFVTSDCISCAYAEEGEADEEADGNDAAAVEYEASALCKNNYLEALKCEKDLTGLYYPNNDGCDIIENMSTEGSSESVYKRHYKIVLGLAIAFLASTLILAIIALRLCCNSRRKIHLNEDDYESRSHRSRKYYSNHNAKDVEVSSPRRRPRFFNFNCFKSSAP